MEKFNALQSWVDNVAYSHSKSKGTEFQYKRFLEKFCEFTGKSVDTILQDYTKMDEKEFRKLYGLYLRSLISIQSRKGSAPNTINSFVTAIKSFFKYNELPLGFVPIGKGRVVYHNRDITKDEIAKILSASRPRDKAFFCMMAQTGLRPDTLCKLQMKHIEPDFSQGVIPCKVEVPSELTKGQYHSYFTFMGEESIRYLKAYFDSNRPNLTSEDLIFVSYGRKHRGKQASPHTLSISYTNILRKLYSTGVLKYEQRDGKPAELRLYGLRKFFRKYAHQAGFENVQFWMGHTVSEGQDDHYRPVDPEFYRKLYAENAMPNLRIETKTPSETEKALNEFREQDKKEIEKLKRQLRDQSTQIESLTSFKKETLENLHEIAEFRREMKFLKAGNAVVGYQSSGFSPSEVTELADEALANRVLELQNELQKISELLKHRKEPQTE